MITVSELAEITNRKSPVIHRRATDMGIKGKYENHRRCFTEEEAKRIAASFTAMYDTVPQEYITVEGICRECNACKSVVFYIIRKLGIERKLIQIGKSRVTVIKHDRLPAVKEYLTTHPKSFYDRYPRIKKERPELMQPEGYYRVSVQEWDGIYYVKAAGLPFIKAVETARLYREQGFKVAVLPCRRKNNPAGNTASESNTEGASK